MLVLDGMGWGGGERLGGFGGEGSLLGGGLVSSSGGSMLVRVVEKIVFIIL